MAAKLIGNIDYVPQPGYPKFKGESGQESIVVQYVQPIDSITVPDYNTRFYDARYKFFSRFTSLLLKSKQVDVMNGALSAKITLEYATGSPSDTPNVEESIECENVEIDFPIEKHPNYLTIWNYDLICKEGQGGGYWTDWDKTTDHTVPSGYTDFYKWIRNGDGVPEGWYVESAAIKKGVESFKGFVPEVVVVRTSRNKASLEKTMALDCTPQTPPDTFERSGEWLQSGSTIKEEGNGWVLRTSYLNSKTVDSDIYPAVGVENNLGGVPGLGGGAGIGGLPGL